LGDDISSDGRGGSFGSHKTLDVDSVSQIMAPPPLQTPELSADASAVSPKTRPAANPNDEINANPSIPVGRITRAALLQRLEAQLDKKLILLRAPAGFGKTTILRDLRDALAGGEQDCVWVELAAGDADAIGFASAIAGACRQAGLDGEDAHDLSLWPSSAGSPEAMLTHIARRLQAHQRPIVVFIDEYHNAAGVETDWLLNIFLQQAPEHLRVILAARSEPACGAAKLRLAGALAEFTRSDLAFDIIETDDLFRDDGLPQSDIETLFAKTEGWPAALGLAKLWIRGHGNASAAARFSGDLAIVGGYLEQEVFTGISQELKGILIETAMFPFFDEELINAILLRHDSDVMLRRLKGHDELVVLVDPERGRFCCHPLVKEHLMGIFATIGDEDHVKTAYLRAADYFDAKGETLCALEHAIAAGDEARIEAVLGRNDFGLLQLTVDARAFTRIMGRLESYAPRLAQQLSPLRALCCIRQGRLDEAKERLDSIKKEMTSTANENCVTFAQADYILIDALYRYYADAPDINSIIIGLENARATRFMSSPIYAGILDSMLGAFQFRAGRIDAADALNQAGDSFMSARAHYNFIRNNLHRGMISMVRADISGAKKLYADARHFQRKYLHDDFCLSAMIDVSEAVLLYETGALVDALAILPAARNTIIAGGDYWVELLRDAYRTEARLLYCSKGLEAAHDLLDQGVDFAHERQLPRLVQSLMVQKLHLAAIAGKHTEAKAVHEEIARHYGSPENVGALRFGWREQAERALVEIRFEISRKRGDLAITMLEAFDQRFSSAELEWFALKSATLRALALNVDGEPAEAVSVLRPLMEKGEALGVYSFFLEEGGQAQALLDEAARRFCRTKQAESFNRTIMDWLVRSSSYLPPDQRLAAPDLTARQRRILNLLAEGLDRSAIAERTGTSTHNVQYHIKNMFGAFGVASSGRLVAEAIRLKLVDEGPFTARR
jgi:ATP/maltotriose-dependent transcriptional regulator MalT